MLDDFLQLIVALILLCIIFLLRELLWESLSDETKAGMKALEDEKERKRLHGGYKCPNCGQHAGHKIGTLSKSISVGTLGLASNKIGKTYKCENCKYMW